jgi:antitoxin component YwqK of YwqJK toxin-antitoxin module
MRTISLAMVLFLWGTIVSAQEKLAEPKEFQEIVDEYIAFKDSSEFEEAIKVLDLIPRGDSNYTAVLLEKVYCLTELEKYDEALEICEEQLKEELLEERQTFWHNKAFLTGAKGNYKEAVDEYLALKEAYPFYKKTYRSLYAHYLEGEEYAKAYEFLKEYALLFPFDVNAHLNLGVLAFNEGHLTETFMALNMCILLDPDSERALDILAFLNELSNNTKKEIEPKEGFDFESDEYDEIDLLIENYIALDKKYKVDTKSELFLAKQNHLILSRLAELEVSDYFFSSYYAPFYQQILKEGKYSDMQHFQLAPSTNEKHKALVEKEIKKLRAFNTWLRDAWWKLHDEQSFDLKDIKGKYNVWFNGDGTIDAIGHTNEATGAYVDDFIFFYEDGNIKSTGSFKENKRDKHWTFYYKNGQRKQQLVYEEGKVVDTVKFYHSNGVISEITTLKDELREGPYAEYYENGARYKEGFYSRGLFEGEITYYSKAGGKEYLLNYKEGELDKALIEYYLTGELYRKEEFVEGKSQGAYQLFWRDGSKRAVGSKADGLFDGMYQEYYTNGQLKREGMLKEGEETGVWKWYDKEGKLSQEAVFENGLFDGVKKEYDIDGKLYAEKVFDKDWLISYKYFDKEGKVIAEGGHNKKEFDLKIYYPNGVLSSEGKYVYGKGKQETWKEYDEYGNLDSEYALIDGKIEGEAIQYHPWGEKKKILHYSNGVLDGYYADYYDFGQLYSQGYYKEGELNGPYEEYYPDGQLKTRGYYHKGKIIGTYEEYAVNGKLDHTEEYENGVIVGGTYYDTLGQVRNTFHFKNKEGMYEKRHFNKALAFKGKYILGSSEGPYTWYHPNGQLATKGSFVGNEREGNWVYYYEDGSKETEGAYQFGDRHGRWINYNQNGTLERESNYVDGDIHGIDLQYDENGKKLREIEYRYGKVHGRYLFYDPSGELQMGRVYHDGIFQSYYYYNSDNEKVSVPIVNGTAEVKAKFSNGNPSREFKLKNGYFTGAYKSYYLNGQLETDYVLKYDSKLGTYKEYYPSGKLKEEANYYYDNLDGVKKEYFANGKMKKQSSYKMGVKHGPELVYSDKGELVEETYFYNGQALGK